MMMFDPGIRQQLLTRPKAEMCFRPWWDTIEDTVLVSMIGLGNNCAASERISWDEAGPNMIDIVRFAEWVNRIHHWEGRATKQQPSLPAACLTAALCLSLSGVETCGHTLYNHFHCS